MIKGADGHVATIGTMAERPAVTTSTSYLLMKAGTLMGREIDAALASCDLTARQFLLLATVAEHQAESQQVVSRIMHLDPTLVVAVVDDLEERGLVVRTRQPDDRRRILLSLTPAGSRLLTAATKAAEESERAFVAELSAPDQATLRRLLAKVMTTKLGS